MRGPKFIALPIVALVTVIGINPGYAWLPLTDSIQTLVTAQMHRGEMIEGRLLFAQADEQTSEAGEVDEAAEVEEGAEVDEESQPADSSGEAAAPTLDEIVERVQTFYDDIEDYHADFVQTYANIALADEQVSSGHVFFRKPGMMRWDYAAPMEKYLISDGETLWIYEPEFNQVARAQLSSNDLPTAIRFLMGEGNLSQDFEISQIECDEADAYCLSLIPRISQGHYRSLEFVVDSTEFSVRETTIIDPIGNQNHFEFSNVATTDDLPEAGFHFTPTPEMRVITP